MPLYEYACLKCKHEWETLQKITDRDYPDCPECKSKKVKKVMSRNNFTTQGRGFYARGGKID